MTSQTPEPLIRITWAKTPIYALVGILIYTFSLNGLLKKLAENSSGLTSQFLFGLANIPDKIYNSLPGSQFFLFELLIRWLILSMIIFLFILLLNSIRLKSAAFFCSGAGGLCIGVFLFTWISIVLYLIFIIIFVIKWFFGWISFLLSTIFSAILAFILWSPIFYSLIGLGLLGAIIFLLSNFDELWEKLLEFLKSNSFIERALKILLIGGLGLGLLVGGIYLFSKIWREYLQPIFESIRNWLSLNIVPLIGWIFWLLLMVLLFVITLAFIGLTLVILGYQYCDQFYSAKNCGRSTYKVFDIGFGLGAVIALVFFVCSANSDYQILVNAGWNNTIPYFNIDLVGLIHTLMPNQTQAFLQSLFVKASLPIFDVTSLIIALFIANCSLLMGLISGTIEEPLHGLFRKERLPLILLVLFGILVMIATSAIDAEANRDG